MKNFLYPEWVLLLWAARQARPAGALVGRSHGGVRHRSTRPRHRRQGQACARCKRPHAGARRRDGGQPRRLSVGKRPGRLGRRCLDGAGRRLRHSSHCGRRARRLHQHGAGRCLSRRWQARGQLHRRARHRSCGAPALSRSRRSQAAEPDRLVSAQDGDGHGDRLRAASSPTSMPPWRGPIRRASRRDARRPGQRAGCAASASAASSKPRAAHPTRVPRCVSRATGR